MTERMQRIDQVRPWLTPRSGFYKTIEHGLSLIGPCAGCFGRGVRPFNRHGTLERCGECNGTGVVRDLCGRCGCGLPPGVTWCGCGGEANFDD